MANTRNSYGESGLSCLIIATIEEEALAFVRLSSPLQALHSSSFTPCEARSLPTSPPLWRIVTFNKGLPSEEVSLWASTEVGKAAILYCSSLFSACHSISQV